MNTAVTAPFRAYVGLYISAIRDQRFAYTLSMVKTYPWTCVNERNTSTGTATPVWFVQASMMVDLKSAVDTAGTIVKPEG